MATKKTTTKKSTTRKPTRKGSSTGEVEVRNVEFTGRISGKVRMGSLPGTINEYEIGGSKTVGELLNDAGISAAGHEVRVNNAIANTEQVLMPGDIVLLVKNIRGNN